MEYDLGLLIILSVCGFLSLISDTFYRIGAITLLILIMVHVAGIYQISKEDAGKARTYIERLK